MFDFIGLSVINTLLKYIFRSPFTTVNMYQIEILLHKNFAFEIGMLKITPKHGFSIFTGWIRILIFFLTTTFTYETFLITAISHSNVLS